MAYKPLSQTVTDGQKNPISSDAVYDAIDAIPDGANTALSNLAAPTAVNQDLILDAGKSILGTMGSRVETGITTSVNNSTTVNTSASITDVLQIGDIICLEGLTANLVSVVTKPSATQITVNRALGDNTSRQILIVKPLQRLKNNSSVDFLSILNDDNRQILFSNLQGHQKLFIGSLPNNSTADVLVIGNNAFAAGPTSTVIGHGAGKAGVSSGYTKQTIIGYEAGASITQADKATFVGYRAGFGVTGGPAWDNTMIGALSGANISSGSSNTHIGSAAGGTGNVGGSVAIGAGARAGDSAIAIGLSASAGSSSIVLKGSTTLSSTLVIGGVNTGYFNSSPGLGTGSFTMRLSYPADATDVDGSNGVLTLASTQSRGVYDGGDVQIQTASSGSSGNTLTPYVTRLFVSGEGYGRYTDNFGIKTALPTDPLTVEGDTRIESGNLKIQTPGNGLQIAEGSDATMGVVTLAAGTATVSTTAVKNNSRIMLTNQNPGGTVGFLHVSARTADTSFVITSSNAADTSDIAWMIVNPVQLFDADADAYISAASISTESHKNAIDKFVRALKLYKIWDNMVALYPFMGGTNTAHSYNLKNTSQYQISWNGTLTHDSSGVAGDGSTGYGDTGINPNSVLEQNATCVGVYYQISTNAGTECELGVVDATARLSLEGYIATGLVASPAVQTFNNSSPTNGHNGQLGTFEGTGIRRLLATRRRASNDERAGDTWRPSAYPLGNKASTGRPNGNIFISALNTVGTGATNFSAKAISFAFIGKRITEKQFSRLATEIQTLQTALSRNV